SNQRRTQFSHALDAFASGDLEGARTGFAAIVRDDPSDQESARMLERIDQALARARAQTAGARMTRAPATADTARAATTARPAAPAGPRLSDRELEDLYQHGIAALKAGRSDEALHYLELVWSARPDYREAAAYLKREYLMRGIEAFAAGRLDEAEELWQRVLRVDPADPRARGYLERVEKQREHSREILGARP
ncbi:MAG TPA: tetratricopeptide repeat protein, partial [Dongiaceae bacterium]|nr:tetratricopeptide repeat protein [Dongiaceae bacterium]